MPIYHQSPKSSYCCYGLWQKLQLVMPRQVQFWRFPQSTPSAPDVRVPWLSQEPVCRGWHSLIKHHLGATSPRFLPKPLEPLIFPLLFSVSSFVKNAPPILLNLGRTRREAGGEQAQENVTQKQASLETGPSLTMWNRNLASGFKSFKIPHLSGFQKTDPTQKPPRAKILYSK